MKADKIFQELVMLAEKLGVSVSEQNFRQTNVKAQSGLCTVKGQKRFILDKHKSFYEKSELLAACLSQMPTENIYIVPAVRDFLNKFKA